MYTETREGSLLYLLKIFPQEKLNASNSNNSFTIKIRRFKLLPIFSFVISIMQIQLFQLLTPQFCNYSYCSECKVIVQVVDSKILLKYGNKLKIGQIQFKLREQR